MNADACNSHVRAIYMNTDSCIFGAPLCNSVIRKGKRSVGQVTSPLRALNSKVFILQRGPETHHSDHPG